MNLKTRRTIRVQIESRLKAGDSKQDVYDNLKRQFGDEPFIRKVLSEVPSLATRKNHVRINRVLIVVLVCVAVAKTVFNAVGMTAHTPGALLSLLIPIGLQLLLIMMIHGWNRMSYLITAVYGGLQFLDYGREKAPEETIFILLFTVIQFLWAIAIALSVYLYFKLKEEAPGQ